MSPTLFPSPFVSADYLPATPEPYGRFKATSSRLCQIDASNDIEAVARWLEEHQPPRYSAHTAANYRKEVERLYLWSRDQGIPLSGLGRREFAKYEEFLADPQPAERWVGKAVRRSSENWRPFTGKLKPASIQQAFDVIRALYSWLYSVGYLTLNPFASKGKHIGRGPRGRTRKNEPFFDKATWSFLIDFIDAMPQASDREKRIYYRTRWLFSLLYISSARRAEIAGATMGDLFSDQEGYWLHVLGKGKKVRDIAVSDELIDELRRYRVFLGLSPMPGTKDDRPLVFDLWGKGPITSKMIYVIVKETCHLASVELEKIDPARAKKLEDASTHWLRHSSLSHMGDYADLRTLTQKAGHASLKTATIYQHKERKALHDECSRLKVRK